MAITIFFIILSIIVIGIAIIIVRKNNRFYRYKSKDEIKKGIRKRKKTIKTIWGIEEINNGMLINLQGQNSMILEIGSIEYRLLNECEQDLIDISLTKISRTLSNNMQFFSTAVRVDTNEKIYEIRENMKKQKNQKMKEYGEDIIEYLENIMQDENLYVRRNYIIISTYESSEEARKNLTILCNTLIANLKDIKINARILNSNEIIDLLNKEINKDSTDHIELIIENGGLNEFVTGK